MLPSEHESSKKPRTQIARRSITPRKRLSESEGDGLCVVCAHPIEIYAVGHCNHIICFKCSTKIRLLCDENFCPVCRKELDKVIFSKNRATFKELNTLKLIKDRDYNVGIYFADIAIIKDYQKILEHKCPVCPERPPDITFEKTKIHLRREHTLFYCDICLEHNRTFTSECKVYNRKDLATHKRVGDTDDKSHRGHPLCEYCDVRYLDDDKLFHHLRTSHYYCHLCDNGDTNEFYGTYIDLRHHFKKQHYLCEIGGCAQEEFTSVFRTEIDFKAHCASVHKDNKNKQQLKKERQIDLGFQYAKRESSFSRGGGKGYASAEGRPRPQRNTRSENLDFSNAFERDSDLERAIKLSKKETEKPKEAVTLQDSTSSSGVIDNDTHSNAKLFDCSNFPSLADTKLTDVKTSSVAGQEISSGKPVKESTDSSQQWNKNPGSFSSITEKDFPSLRGQKPVNSTFPNWGNKKSVKHSKSKTHNPQTKQSASSFKDNDVLKNVNSSQVNQKIFNTEDDFPSLSPLSSAVVEKKSVHSITKSASKNTSQDKPPITSSKIPLNDTVTKSMNRPKVEKNAFENNDFPSLNPLNSVLVGRGSGKHLASFESYSDETTSNVKLVNAEVKTNSEHVHMEGFSGCADDFPALQSVSNVSAPPGFSKVKVKPTVVVDDGRRIPVGDSLLDFPSFSSANPIKNIRAPPGFSSIPNKSKKNQSHKTNSSKQNKKAVPLANDFPELLTVNKNVVGFTAGKADSTNDTLSFNNETSESLGQALVSQPQAPSFASNNQLKPKKRQKGFRSKNLDEDFPVLEAPSLVQYFQPPSPQPCIQTDEPKEEQTGTSLNLANVFDFS